MKNNRPYLRFIEGTDGGTQDAASAQPEQAETDTATSEDQDVDYKAKYEAMKAHSREWEAKAKANLAAAKKLEELEEADKTDLQKLTDRAASIEAERDQLKVELNWPKLFHLLRRNRVWDTSIFVPKARLLLFMVGATCV